MDEGKQSGFDEINEEYTVESILAEYKSEAFINGDKRTPKEILDEETRRIVETQRRDETSTGMSKNVVNNTAGNRAPSSDLEMSVRGYEDSISDRFEFIRNNKRMQTNKTDDFDVGDVFARIDAQENGTIPDIESSAVNDSDLEYFDSFEYSDYTPDTEIQRAVANAIEREAENEEESQTKLFNRTLNSMPRKKKTDIQILQEELEDEPDYRTRAKQYADRCNRLSPRVLAAGVITVFMIVLTLLFEAGRSLPFGVGKSPSAAYGLFLILHLIVLLLASDLFSYGADRLISGKATLESLLLLSGIAVVLEGIFTLLQYRNGTDVFGGTPSLPYSVVNSVAVVFALIGERMYLQGLAATLRQAASSIKPQARDTRPIISEYRSDLDRTIIKQTNPPTRGFYANLMQADSCQEAYSWLAPSIIIFAVLISALSALLHMDILVMFPRMFAGILVCSTVFQGALSFASPFLTAVKASKRRGVSLAGAGGAYGLYFIDGVCITDDDIYPPGTITLGKARIMDDYLPDKALAYTASLITSSGGGLGRVFSDYASRRNLNLHQIQEFTYYEDGLSGYIDGDRVMSGSSAFMKLFRVKLPEGFDQSNAVYTAVNGKLIAMFPVDYTPMATIQRSLTTIMRRGVRCFLAVRDFNITPKMVSRSFSVPEDDLESLPITKTHAINENYNNSRAVALLSRGGMDVYSETLVFGRRLKFVSSVLTTVTVIASILGALIITILLWNGEWELARASRILLFLSLSAILSITAAVIGSFIKSFDF